MTGPLWYLAGRSARNRLLRQVRRLRTPRYALALVLGLAYLWAVTARQRPSSGPRDVNPANVELLGAVGVTILLSYAWLFGADRRALAFSRAEVTWLFPAPVSRRQLIQYKLLRGQFVILFNAILWTVLLSGGWSEINPWSRALSIWVLITTLTLHRLGVALFRSSLIEHGMVGVRTRAITLTLVGIAVVAAVIDASGAMPLLRSGWGQGPQAFMAALREVADRPVLHALLLPARLVVRPITVETPSQWIHAIVPAVGLLLLNLIWVVRSDAAFEESAAAAALSRHRPGRTSRAPSFTARRIPQLAATGWPAAALLWKNLAAVVRTSRTRGTVVAYAVAGLIVAGLGIAHVGTTLLEIVGWMTAMWAGFLLLLGPQWVRNDLRSELARVAVLRSYPLRGRTVVGAESAGSTAVLTALELGLLAIAYIAFLGTGVDEPSPQLRSAVLAAAVVLLPVINFLAMLIQNGTALLLPGWVRVGPDRPIGVEALGHNMLMMSGFVLVLGGLLLIPAGAAFAVFVRLEPTVEWWAAAPAAAAAVVIAAAEAHLLLGRLGRMFEGIDPSTVPPADG